MNATFGIPLERSEDPRTDIKILVRAFIATKNAADKLNIVIVNDDLKHAKLHGDEMNVEKLSDAGGKIVDEFVKWKKSVKKHYNKQLSSQV